VGDGGLAPAGDSRLEQIAALLRAGAPERVRDGIHALDLAADPLRFALGLLRLRAADVVVAGPSVTGPELADQAAWLFGPEARQGGSASWLLLPNDRLVAFAPDGATDESTPSGPPFATVVGPEVAARHHRLTGSAPRVAELPGFRGEADVLIFGDPGAAATALEVAGALAGALRIGPVLLGVPGVGRGGGEGNASDIAIALAATAAALALMGTGVGT
jgi:phosphotransacetylase